MSARGDDDDLAAVVFFVIAGGLLYWAFERARFASSSSTGTAPSFAPNAPGTATGTPLTRILPVPQFDEGIQSIVPLTMSPNGIAFLKSEETLSRTVRTDSGHPEIGWGHDIVANDPALIAAGVNQAQVMSGTPITVAQANAILDYDLVYFEGVVNQSVAVALSQGQFDALVDFAFNEGAGHFRSSTLLRLLNQGNYAGAAAQFKRWDFAQGRRSTGLASRRQGEQNMFSGGTGGTS